MRAVCINLDRSPDRWAWMSAQADRLSIVLERFSAIDYRSPVYAEEVHMASLSSGQMPGQVACTFSHRRCWELLLASGESQLAIFEDDAMLDDAMAPILASRLPNVIDLLKLETTGERVILDLRVAGRIGPVELRRMYAKHISRLHLLCWPAAPAIALLPLASTRLLTSRTSLALAIVYGLQSLSRRALPIPTASISLATWPFH